METRGATQQRLATREKRLETVEKLLADHPLPPEVKVKLGWQAIVGTFANDPLYEEAMRSGREWREAQHESPEGAS